MNGRRTPWWVWLVVGIVLLNVLTDLELPIFPLVVGAFILAKVLGHRSRISSGPPRRGPGGGFGELPRGHGPLADAHDTWTTPAQDSPMPTIDVPRYPGGTTTPGAPPPVPPPYGTGPVPSPEEAAGARHTSSDPVVSLGQLHLSRCGRDLQAAARQGTATDVARVLDEVKDLSRRMQDMLGAAEGAPGSGRREFRTGLRAIDRLVEEARGEHPPGARLTRLTQACLRMGQTGRHE